MIENKRSVGSHYEEIAAAFLEQKGVNVLEKNFRTQLGEIDIVAKDGEYLCFVEVKFRTDKAKGLPSEAVGRSKQRTIFKVAQNYLKYHKLSFSTPCRFDVIAILGKEIVWYKNAFGSF